MIFLKREEQTIYPIKKICEISLKRLNPNDNTRFIAFLFFKNQTFQQERKFAEHPIKIQRILLSNYKRISHLNVFICELLALKILAIISVKSRLKLHVK